MTSHQNLIDAAKRFLAGKSEAFDASDLARAWCEEHQAEIKLDHVQARANTEAVLETLKVTDREGREVVVFIARHP